MTKTLTKINIRGLIYKVVLFDERAFNILHPDTLACVQPDCQEIRLTTKSLDIQTMRHEMCHAYMSASLYDSCSDINMRDMEEMFCEVVGHFGPDIIKNAANVYKIYQKEMKTCQSKAK